MIRCPELKNLPKVTSLTSLNFHQTVPGKPNFLLAPFVRTSKFPAPLVDPEHPSMAHLRSLRQDFPSFVSKVLCVRAYPKALLEKPAVYWPDPPFRRAKYVNWKDRTGESEARNKDVVTPSSPNRRKTVDMAMVNTVGKKIHKSAVIRNKISAKLKTATSLIVTRGAYARKVETSADRAKENRKSDKGKRMRLVFNEGEEKDWILRDWVYIYQPTLEIYRLPYPELVRTLRSALGMIWVKGTLMERAWHARNDPALNLQPAQKTSDRCREIKQAQHSSPSNADSNESFSNSRQDPRIKSTTSPLKLKARIRPRISRDGDKPLPYSRDGDKYTQSSKNIFDAKESALQLPSTNSSRLSAILRKHIAEANSELLSNSDTASDSVLGDGGTSSSTFDVTLDRVRIEGTSGTPEPSKKIGSISIPLFRKKPIFDPPF